jgi:hypothetical protein
MIAIVQEILGSISKFKTSNQVSENSNKGEFCYGIKNKTPCIGFLQNSATRFVQVWCVVSYFEGRRELCAFDKNEVLKEMFRPQGTVQLIQHDRATAAIRRGGTAAAA